MSGCHILPFGSLGRYTYVVVLSRYQGQWLFSRHRRRDTYETQGGHVEPGESPEQAARRELWEESGARAFALTPLCDYWYGDEAAGGAAYLAEITALDPLPALEMAEVRAFPGLPPALTYPQITPFLYQVACERLAAAGVTAE